jgi:hypothetical protein
MKECKLELTRSRIRLLIATSMLLLAACSGKQIYESAAGWRQNECQKVLESAERTRCMEAASKDYDSYSREKDKR